MVLKYTQSLNKISELNVINSQQELDLLKSQIHPHFLFNTLNNLYRLVMNNGHAGEIVLKLSETLRFTLYETNTAFITLDKEIEFLKNYIELEKINHYSNVDLKYNFKDIQNDKILIAPMLFISFVENVLKHGRNESIDKCWIDIKLKQSKHKVFFEISNSVSISSYPSVRKDLSNMRKRLDILYPDKYALEIYDEKSFYKVNLTLNLE
ncbi:sensor histidine kinase [Anditalea andensis]|nr:sensor histidine kinase [Anditalea andensis]